MHSLVERGIFEPILQHDSILFKPTILFWEYAADGLIKGWEQELKELDDKKAAQIKLKNAAMRQKERALKDIEKADESINKISQTLLEIDAEITEASQKMEKSKELLEDPNADIFIM